MNRRTKASPAAVEETEDTRVENFGRYIYDSFLKTVSPSIFEPQLRYYGDYIHHFGFFVEAKTRAQSVSFLPSTKPPHGRHDGLSFSHDGAACGDDVVVDAGWGIGESEQKEADAQARAVGPLDAVTKLEEITAKVIAPFQQSTWRQSGTQCLMKKARALYCWLCENITVELPSPSSAVEEEAASAVSTAKKVAGRKGTAASRSSKRKVGVDVQSTTVPVEVVDPLETAICKRTADPLILARLYQKCLYWAQVESKVVEGYVRGRAPEEVIEWAWNIVCIPQGENSMTRYLVDVALSAYTGPLRHTTRNKDVVEETEADREPSSKDLPSAKSKRPAVPQKEKPKQNVLDGPILASSVSAEKCMESFYFNTHPQEFCFTHLPKESQNTLLLNPPRKTLWEGAPCLTHTFFRFPLALQSHRRRCLFTVRSTPFYISLVNEKPERTELSCFIYKGTLEALPEDLSTATPLGPQWVWHQREEATNSETFTIMVPEAGHHSVVVGARTIRQNPFTAVVSEELFVPVVAYQVLVTFVPHQLPQFPRQYFTPSVCKLLAPLTPHVPEGSTNFVVMPSCPNVAGVAVVSKQPSEGARSLLAFLTFSPQNVAYTGNVVLTSGSEAEVWILYAAPDHNYVNLTELPRAEPRFQTRFPSVGSDVGNSRCVSPHLSLQKSKRESNLLFLPFVTGIDVKKPSAAVTGGCYIQPQPTLEEEKEPTLRRLIGVTPELLEEATAAMLNKLPPVGSYFDKKISLGWRAVGDV
ncbi:hypothetical protein MOQ_001127 [Trypanosoma cruzi marinkellei]|uniref:Uncharacterized protein n=1 Tax=Trypanosoma cruzi marinkellei TaxID=85056 RepID=K2MTV3_TRYCR|nr:hypothetical protein MOQ_001127 [Trypanosoma cruzi marinkellei]